MKRIIAIILCLALLLTGCATTNPPDKDEPTTSNTDTMSLEFSGLNDENLLSYVEDVVYSDTIKNLNNTEYVVEEVQTVYISKEYIEETSFNSQSNVYFGYTIDELNAQFQGSKYIFTLGDNGKTVVQELEEIPNTTGETMLKNVLMGSGVILVCTTVSFVTAAVGAPVAVSVIFAVSAASAKTMALSSAMFGAVISGIVKGYQTGDVEEALEAAALGATEGFKIGAITGALTGGALETLALKIGTKSGLTMSEVAKIQLDSNLPLDVISQIHSMDEYLVYKNAGLKAIMVNGKTALVQNIDLNYISELPDGTQVTNLVRMQKGYAPLDPATGKAYQLHHIKQDPNGTLAVLTEAQHQGNSTILNIFDEGSLINRTEFSKTRKEFWQYLGNSVFVNGGI